MLLALALCLATAPAPRATVEHAGFLSDARAELRADGRLAFEARLHGPATLTRTCFVVEGLGADGALLFERPVRARVSPAAARRRSSAEARFELELPALDGVQRLRVRCALRS